MTKAEASKRIDALKDKVAKKQQHIFTVDERGQTQPSNKDQAQRAGQAVSEQAVSGLVVDSRESDYVSSRNDSRCAPAGYKNGAPIFIHHG